MQHITFQKWYIQVNIIINQDYVINNAIALVDSGADMNFIQEGLVPTKYFEITMHSLKSASGNKMKINYKLSDVCICNKGICIPTNFLLVKNLQQEVIVGTPFLNQIMPIQKINPKGISCVYKNQKLNFEFIQDPETKILNELKQFLVPKEKHLSFLKTEVYSLDIENKLKSKVLKSKILDLEKDFKKQICSNHPNAFWDRKQHIVSLPYENDFNERKQIPTKARPSQMNSEYLELCKKEIQDLLSKNLIRKSYSPWSCTAFYVNKASEKERGVPRLVINYKPLNDVLKWIRYPIPNKKDLLDRLFKVEIFLKFELKSEYWHI